MFLLKRLRGRQPGLVLLVSRARCLLQANSVFVALVQKVEQRLQRGISASGKQNVAVAAKEKVACKEKFMSIRRDADADLILTDILGRKRRRLIGIVQRKSCRQLDLQLVSF